MLPVSLDCQFIIRPQTILQIIYFVYSTTTRYLDDILTGNNPGFHKYAKQIDHPNLKDSLGSNNKLGFI
jgi:hypothetical protein